MADNWQIDIERMTASFGNFVVKLHRTTTETFALEIGKVPALREEEALTLAGEAALALAHALEQHNTADSPT